MFTQSFPPADDLISKLQEIDYKKHLNKFMDRVEIFCIFMVAIAIIIRDKWVQHHCTERLQIFAIQVIEGLKVFYAWMQNVFIPECKSFYDDCRSFYNLVTVVKVSH